MIHSDIMAKMPLVIKLFEKHEIKNAYLFGSVLTNKFTADSDVDLLVNLNDGLDPVVAGGHLWDLQFELEDLLNREVDLLTESSLKNPYFILSINKNRELIYG